MRASDLIGLPVVGAGGKELGRVLDARVVQDGPLMGAFAALRIDALVVGRHGLLQHLGYDRSSSTGPLLIKKTVRALTHHNRLLPWEDARIEDGRVLTDRIELDPLPDL
jgi:hypothetical protein